MASATYLFTRIDLADLNWHTRKYSKWTAYEQSKLANLLFVHELAARGIRAYASDPGATNTDITRSLGMAEHRRIRSLLHTPEQGARASLHATLVEDGLTEAGLASPLPHPGTQPGESGEARGLRSASGR